MHLCTYALMHSRSCQQKGLNSSKTWLMSRPLVRGCSLFMSAWVGHVGTYVRIYIQVFMDVYMYMYICIYVHVYMYICTYKHVIYVSMSMSMSMSVSMYVIVVILINWCTAYVHCTLLNSTLWLYDYLSNHYYIHKLHAHTHNIDTWQPTPQWSTDSPWNSNLKNRPS